MASLYEITAALAAYEMQFDEDGVWINEEELEQLNIERDDKIEGILCWIKNLTAEAKAIREEEKALAARRKAIENKADHLADYVALNLDGQKFETPKVAVRWRNTEAVEILDEEKIPQEFLRVSTAPNKDAIKKFLKSLDADSEVCEWAEMKYRKSMSIK